MKKPPPYLVRRIFIAPLFVIGSVAALVAIPLWLIVAAFASRFIPGRWRPLRVAWFLFVYLALEALMLIVLFLVWIASGLGWKLRSARFEDLHYRLAAWWLGLVMGSARRTFNLVIEAQNATDESSVGRPALVFSRHAGPGDSFLLVDALLNGRDRRPRIILKDMLQLDPCVDVLLNRVPTTFVPSTGRAGNVVVESIAELARDIGSTGAFVLFPEGGNFTESRRKRAIEKLDEIGRPGLADRAREMQHLLPPKPTGALTAIESAPNADVIFVGHVGLEQFATMRDLWRGIPMDANVVSRVWTVAADEVPPAAEQEHWLYDQWQTIDDWIDETIEAQSPESKGSPK